MNKTKLYSSFAMLLFAFTLSTNAQNFQLGIRYEPEYSALMNSNDANAGPALNYASHFTYLNFGIGGVYNFNKNIGLAVDALLSREGQNFTGNFGNSQPNQAAYSQVVSTQIFLNNLVVIGDYAAKAELNFIKLPIMLSLTSDNTKPAFLSLLVGPQINIIYNVAQEVNHTDEDYPNTNIAPINLYKTVTLDGVAELGAGLNLCSHVVLSARFRFDYGFEDVENKNLMVSYYGAAPVRFYSDDRQATHNATAGLLIGLDFKL
jgi:hypothetical protein